MLGTHRLSNPDTIATRHGSPILSLRVAQIDLRKAVLHASKDLSWYPPGGELLLLLELVLCCEVDMRCGDS